MYNCMFNGLEWKTPVLFAAYLYSFHMERTNTVQMIFSQPTNLKVVLMAYYINKLEHTVHV